MLPVAGRVVWQQSPGAGGGGVQRPGSATNRALGPVVFSNAAEGEAGNGSTTARRSATFMSPLLRVSMANSGALGGGSVTGAEAGGAPARVSRGGGFELGAESAETLWLWLENLMVEMHDTQSMRLDVSRTQAGGPVRVSRQNWLVAVI
jgi:hypothetical protein